MSDKLKADRSRLTACVDETDRTSLSQSHSSDLGR